VLVKKVGIPVTSTGALLLSFTSTKSPPLFERLGHLKCLLLFCSATLSISQCNFATWMAREQFHLQLRVSASSILSWYWYLITNQRINTDMNLVKIIFIIKLIYKHHSRYPTTLLVHHHSSSIIACYHHSPFLSQRSHHSSRHWTKNSLSLIFPI